MIKRNKSLILITILCILLSSCYAKYQTKPQTASTPDATVTEKATADNPQTSPSDGVIAPEDAKKIAFEHAGIAEADAKRLKAELDYDDGIQVYEIEFEAGGFEYDYDINAKTGEILKFDKERD